MRRFVWFATTLAAGCTYPEFSFVPGDDTAPPVEDTYVVVEDTRPDTTTMPDTFVEDTRPEAMPDTVAEAEVAPPIDVCATSAAKFCCDWDTSPTAWAEWSAYTTTATGNVAIDAAGGRSLPNAFVATTSPGTGAVVTANVNKQFTTAAADSLIKFDAWIKLESATYPTALGGFAFLFKIQRLGGGGDGMTFQIDDTGFLVDRIGVMYEAYRLTYKPKAGVWMHVRVHTKIHSTAGAITVWIDDMITPVFTRTAISTAKGDSTDKQAIVGLYSSDSSGTFRVRYDDVELDY